jgi:hypothetical protein
MVSAGGGVLAADAKKEGAEKANEQLQAAGDKAIGTLTQARDQSAAAYAPYTQSGANAMNALNTYMGLPTIPTGGASTGPPLAIGPGTPVDTTGKTDKGLGLHVPSSDAEMTGRQGVPRSIAAPTAQTQAIQQTASGYTPLGGVGAGGFVQMRAPTGQTSWVPRQQAPFYAQRGAVEVS